MRWVLPILNVFSGRENGSPAPSPFSLKAAVVALALASLLPLLVIAHVDSRFPGDDPLITLTFAKNLARGDGFVFNHPPPVLATTTPAFTLVVAAISALTRLQPTTVALGVGGLSWLALVWSFLLARRAFHLDPGQAALIGVLIAAQGWVVHLSMEAYPFALVLVVAAALVWSGRPLAGGVACGVLFLIRGEGALMAMVLAVVVVVREVRGGRAGRSPTLLYVVGGALPLAAWAAYALPTFGTIIPETLAAKSAQVASGLWLPFPIRLFQEWLPRWGLGPWGAASTAFGYLMVWAGLVEMVVRRRRLLVLPAWGLAYAAGYSFLGVPGYAWYRLPIAFVLLLCAGLGLEGAARMIAGRTGIRWRHALAVAMVAAAGVAVAWPMRHALTSTVVVDERAESYMALAKWFREHARPDQTVAYIEVGALGYYTDMGVLDLVGVVSPQVLPHVLRRDFVTGFWEGRPDYLVHLEGSDFTRPIVDNPRFAGNYVQVAVLTRNSTRRMTIYRRIGAR